MASLMENLIDVLNSESQEYENLLKLSEAKTPIIVAGDLEELARLTDEEQIVVGRINRLEAKRQETFADIAIVINKDVNTLMLADLVDMLSQRPEEQQKLAKIHDNLKRVVHSVKDVNERNKVLIDEAMEMVSFNLNMLQAMKAAPETANYNKGAYNAGMQMGVDMTGFDAHS